jgi:formyl-CoA transferase
MPLRDSPLKDVTVLDLGQIYNGPYAGFLLAMAGADVIKIEPPGGEHLRRRRAGGASLPFAMLNSNKRAVTLNLKHEKGRAIFLDMVERADVVLENFAPDTMADLGLGADVLQQINPRLIYAAGSGFGRSGPHRNRLAMDLTVQAFAGVIDTTGYPDAPPVKAGPAVCDFFGGVHLYGAIVTALYERERTGAGRMVEVAMQDSVYASLSSNLDMHHKSEPRTVTRTGNRHGALSVVPYGVFPTADDCYAAIICTNEGHWRNLVKAMGRDDLGDDARFKDGHARVENMEDVEAMVSQWTRSLTRDQIFQAAETFDIPCAPVRTLDEVVNDPGMHERGMLTWVDHPECGRVVLPNSPLRFDDTPPLPIEPSRPPGGFNDSVFGDWLGLSDDEIRALQEEGVI